MNQKLLDKFLNHQASEKEIQMLKDDPETADFISLSEQVADWKYPGFKAQENWRAILQHTQTQQEESIDTTNKSHFGDIFKLNLTPSFYWRVAAILIIALSTYFFLSPNNTTLITPQGTHQIWNLPDGSQISLNAGSEAYYNQESWNSDRTLELDGEAFFDVTKGSTFSVKTNSGVVTVLGTEFNVKIREDQFSVHCFEGRVKVQTQDTTLMLPAGTGMRLNQGQLISDIVAIGAKPDWMSGESSFENTPLKAVLFELERQYAVNIDYPRGRSTESKPALFSGSFTHEDLSTALKSVCQPFGLSFELSNQNVRIFKD
jgi:ferric-dicitrate binding protein FerR (iron transport regulator)